MNAVVYFGFALFILASFVIQVGSYSKRYIPVISDVHQYFGTSSVFFVSSRNNRRLEDHTSTYTLSRDFSRKYGFTSIMHFDQLKERTKWYQKSQSLLVVFLRSLSDVSEFASNVELRSEPHIWLVIFTDNFGSSAFCKYCESPKGNRFGLRFDTEMLVVCCDILVLKEWWSVDGDHTEVSDFAIWMDEKRDKLRFLVPAALGTRRYDVGGAGIRIGLVEHSPFAYEVGDEILGFFGDILNELKLSMNFTITKIVRSQDHGVFNWTTNNWTGLIGLLTQGQVDLGVSDFSIRKSRLEVIQYTLPLAVSKNRLYIRDQGHSDSVYWTAYFQVFSINIWIVTIVLITSVPMLLAWMKFLKSSRSLPSLIVESYLHVWGIFCQQGLCEFPGELSLQIAYFSIFILALIIYAAYSASLVSFITISPSGLPFTTLRGFVDDGTYRLIVFKNAVHYELFVNSTSPVIERMIKLMKPVAEFPETFQDGVNQVCHEKVALFTEREFKKTSQGNVECKFTGIYSGYENVLAMIMPAGSQYTKVINYHIQRFKETGVMDRIKQKYYDTTYTSVDAKFDELELRNVMPVLVFLTVGVIIALLLLSGEAIYYSLKTNLRSRQNEKRFQNFWKTRTGKLDRLELSVGSSLSSFSSIPNDICRELVCVEGQNYARG